MLFMHTVVSGLITLGDFFMDDCDMMALVQGEGRHAR